MPRSSKLVETLRTVGVFNEYNFAGHGNVFIRYRSAAQSSAGQTAAWQVIRPGFKTDISAHWTDHGNKTFDVWGRDDKATQFEAAKAWAAERYGITEWARTPFGTWMDAGFVIHRLVELKAAVKAKEASDVQV